MPVPVLIINVFFSLPLQQNYTKPNLCGPCQMVTSLHVPKIRLSVVQENACLELSSAMAHQTARMDQMKTSAVSFFLPYSHCGISLHFSITYLHSPFMHINIHPTYLIMSIAILSLASASVYFVIIFRIPFSSFVFLSLTSLLNSLF